jgi:hypothetical protein
MSLSTFVNETSAHHPKHGASIIKSNIDNNAELLGANHPLINADSDVIKNHFETGASLNYNDASSFLAASSILHCLDGWAYLSNAIEALVNGESGIAVHLAYYAELRAAMSFLATEGIAVCNFNHYGINKSSQLIQPTNTKTGTHQFVWNAMDTWVNSSKPDAKLLKYFSVNGKNFEEWSKVLPEANSSVVLAGILKQWLKDWSFDISRFREDREFRNDLSYKPQRLGSFTTSDLQKNIEVLMKYWSILEPTEANRFFKLDQHLFKYFLNGVLNSLNVKRQAVKKPLPLITLEELASEAFKKMGSTLDVSFVNFLSSTQTHALFEKAKIDASASAFDPVDPLSVIARATLLSRVSTGAVSYLYKNAGISFDSLKFIIHDIALNNGICTLNDGFPDDIFKLWNEVSDLLESVEEVIDVLSPIDKNLFYKEIKEPSLSFSQFSQFNRAGIWGLHLD